MCLCKQCMIGLVCGDVLRNIELILCAKCLYRNFLNGLRARQCKISSMLNPSWVSYMVFRCLDLPPILDKPPS